jgi:hypothetical protein
MAYDRQTVKADAAAEKARTKAMRPWYKKKRFIVPLAVVVIAIIAAAAGGGDKASDTAKDVVRDAQTSDTVGTDRADRQREDQEVPIGQSVRVSGYTATVTAATFRPTISQFESDGYLVADVTVANRDDRAQPYNVFHWKLQTPGGQVIDPTFTSEKQLGSGDLVQGGTASGKVVWEIGAAKGQFVIIYKPDPFDAARGIWKVTV